MVEDYMNMSSPQLNPRSDHENLRFSSTDFSAMFDPLDVNSQETLNSAQQHSMYNQEYGNMPETFINQEETEMLMNLFHNAVDRSRSDSFQGFSNSSNNTDNNNQNNDMDQQFLSDINSNLGSRMDSTDEYQRLLDVMVHKNTNGNQEHSKPNKRKRVDSVTMGTSAFDEGEILDDIVEDDNDNSAKSNGKSKPSDRNDSNHDKNNSINKEKKRNKNKNDSPEQRRRHHSLDCRRIDESDKDHEHYNALSNNRKGKKGRRNTDGDDCDGTISDSGKASDTNRSRSNSNDKTPNTINNDGDDETYDSNSSDSSDSRSGSMDNASHFIVASKPVRTPSLSGNDFAINGTKKSADNTKTKIANSVDKNSNKNIVFVPKITLGKQIDLQTLDIGVRSDEASCDSAGDTTVFSSNESSSSISNNKFNLGRKPGSKKKRGNGRRKIKNGVQRVKNGITIALQCEIDPHKTIRAMRQSEAMEARKEIAMLKNALLASNKKRSQSKQASIATASAYANNSKHLSVGLGIPSSSLSSSLPHNNASSGKIDFAFDSFNTTQQLQQFVTSSIPQHRLHSNNNTVNKHNLYDRLPRQREHYMNHHQSQHKYYNQQQQQRMYQLGHVCNNRMVSPSLPSTYHSIENKAHQQYNTSNMNSSHEIARSVSSRSSGSHTSEARQSSNGINFSSNILKALNNEKAPMLQRFLQEQAEERARQQQQNQRSSVSANGESKNIDSIGNVEHMKNDLDSFPKRGRVNEDRSFRNTPNHGYPQQMRRSQSTDNLFGSNNSSNRIGDLQFSSFVNKTRISSNNSGLSSYTSSSEGRQRIMDTGRHMPFLGKEMPGDEAMEISRRQLQNARGSSPGFDNFVPSDKAMEISRMQLQNAKRMRNLQVYGMPLKSNDSSSNTNNGNGRDREFVDLNHHQHRRVSSNPV
jgi:hypothetical protein